jgi:hypothetical protein
VQKTPAKPALTGPRRPFRLLRHGTLLRGISLDRSLYFDLVRFCGAYQQTKRSQFELSGDFVIEDLESLRALVFTSWPAYLERLFPPTGLDVCSESSDDCASSGWPEMLNRARDL